MDHVQEAHGHKHEVGADGEPAVGTFFHFPAVFAIFPIDHGQMQLVDVATGAG